MSKSQLIVWGMGGHAKVVTGIVAAKQEFDLVGYLEYPSSPKPSSDTFLGKQVYRGDDCFDRLRRVGVEFIVFGFGDCAARLRLSPLADAAGLQFATLIHPHASVAPDVQIGGGTVVVAGAVINPASVLGRNVIVNTCASIDHDCIVGEGVHLSPGARLAGGVSVGRGAWLATGVIVAPKVRIGEGAVVGAGSVVLKDLPDRVLAYGSPAKIVRPI